MQPIGEFVDLELIGTGGNAHVYRAVDSVHDRIVAIKILRAGSGDAVRRRFDRERRSMGRLSGITGLLSVYSSGFTPEGEPYLVMPFCPGGSLKDRLDNEGSVPLVEAMRFVRTVALGVEEAHQRDVLHCDIKPSNILIDSDHQPRLADFGIAELIGQTASISGAMVTPSYTPPERFDGSGPSRAGDVYALGATLYALLAGHPPFGSDPSTSQAVLIRQILEDPLPIERLPATVPTSVRNLILQATAKSPSDRIGSAAQLAAALDDEARKLVGQSPAVEAPNPTPPPPTASVPQDRSPASPPLAAGAFDRPDPQPSPGLRSGRPVAERLEMQDVLPDSVLRQPRPAIEDNPTRARPTPEIAAAARSKTPVFVGVLVVVIFAAGAYWFLNRTPALDAPADVAIARTAADEVTITWVAVDEFSYRVSTSDPDAPPPVPTVAPATSAPPAPATVTPATPATFGTAVDGEAFTVEMGYDQALCVQVQALFEGDTATSDEVCIAAADAPPTEPLITIATDDNVIVSGTVASRDDADRIIDAAEAVFDAAVVRDQLWVEQRVLPGRLRVETSAEQHTEAELAAFATFAERIDAEFDPVANTPVDGLPVVAFATGNQLAPDAEAALDQWAAVIRSAPLSRYEVRVHLPQPGAAAAHSILTQDRAAVVVTALVERGVPSAQIQAVGFGEAAALPAPATQLHEVRT